MREESRSLKWQDWRFPSPLTQLGWAPLQMVSIQPLLAICLSMISRTLRDDSGCGIAVGDSVHARVIHHTTTSTTRAVLELFAPLNNFKAHQEFIWIVVVLQLCAVCLSMGQGSQSPHASLFLHWGGGSVYKVCGWLTNCLRCVMLVYLFLS